MEVTDGAGYAIQWQSGTSYIAPSGNYNGGSITYPTILALVFPVKDITLASTIAGIDISWL